MAFGVRFETSGLPMEQVIVRSSSWWHAPSDAVAAVGEQAATIFVGLKKLVSGSIPLANLGGPIQIARVAGSAAEGGLLIFFLTVSWMSINIGMFNLLPLPALDGGALLMQGVEAAYGRPLPLTVQHMVQRLGVALILALIVLVFYNDILRLLGG
jgi:regulator of sigma E protease